MFVGKVRIKNVYIFQWIFFINFYFFDLTTFG